MILPPAIRLGIIILLSTVTFIQARDDMATETQKIAHLLGITKPLTVEVVSGESSNDPKQMKGKDAVSGLTINYGDRARIWLNNHLNVRERCIQLFVMLHELAHAQDPGITGQHNAKRNAENAGRYTIVKRCIAKIRGATLHEWYADWQAIQWMKKHFKKEAQELAQFYRHLIHQRKKNPHSPQYPPYDQLVKWLEA